MKKIAILSMLIAGILGDAIGAARPTGRATARGGAASAPATQTTAARAATNSRTAPRATTSASSGAKTVNRGRAATTTKAPVVAARAATTQKVIGTGTKVAGATKNVVVSEECQQKYDGCMDSFCMLDNETGGRCICSDKNAELDSILAEIEKLDQQSYQMATFGVEKIEMGDDADAAIAKANAAAQSVIDKDDEGKKKARRTLDLSMWDTAVDFEEDDVFGESAMSPIEGKEGDALHRAAAELCVAQIPECSSELQMLQMIYAQRIKSDCAAYENSLKQQKNSSAQKLAAAEKALREAALDQLRTANKYDLGQCTVEFKKCMQTTGGCGDDFSGCASMAAMDSTNTRRSTSKKSKSYQIKGAVTTIEISSSTYDALVAKKPLCESVTKSCVNVASQVWDTFLREVAPQVKNAELIAEDKARQDCIGNISACFQKACKDTIDPNDPDGSYDMCLSRPGTMLNVCKIPLNACGIDATSETAAAKSDIWDFVVARLASMRVDSCTTEVKNCLQADDRCGKDYTQCIGLDTDTIIRMCPYDKLTGCQKMYGEDDIRGDAVYDELSSMVQGIMLNIDNAFLTECQNAANEAMIKVCGSTENCNELAVDEGVGSRSLEYKFCNFDLNDQGYMSVDYNMCRPTLEQVTDEELAGVLLDQSTGERSPGLNIAATITGVIYWDSLENSTSSDPAKVYELLNADEYIAKVEQTTGQVFSAGEKANIREKVNTEVRSLQQSINNAISAIESDPTVQFCMYGREVQGMKRNGADGQSTRTKIGERSADAARFPELTKQMRQVIATHALKIAKENYYKKYDELNEKMLQDYARVGARLAEILGEDKLNMRREAARQACVAFAEASILALSPEPPKSALGQIINKVVQTAGTIAMAVGTGGVAQAAFASIQAAVGTVGQITSTINKGMSIVDKGLAVADKLSGAGKQVAEGVGGARTKIGNTSVSSLGLMTGGAALKSGFDQSGGGNGEATGLRDGDLGEKQLIGSKQLNQWNYKETITSTFQWDTLVCHKCTKKQNCAKTKRPLFGSAFCKQWEDAVEECADTQF